MPYCGISQEIVKCEDLATSPLLLPFQFRKVYNFIFDKVLENPSFWREVFELKGKVAGCEVQGARLLN